MIQEERSIRMVGRGNIGHFEKKKNHMNMWLILNGYRDTGF
jgi:hypothetical protein